MYLLIITEESIGRYIMHRKKVVTYKNSLLTNSVGKKKHENTYEIIICKLLVGKYRYILGIFSMLDMKKVVKIRFFTYYQIRMSGFSG